MEYLFCLSFLLPLCHPQAWPALARVILGRDEQEAESKHMKHEGNVNTYWQKRNSSFLPVNPLKKKKKKPPSLLPSRDKGRANSVFQGNMPKACSRTKNVSLGKQAGYHVALNSSALVLHV